MKALYDYNAAIKEELDFDQGQVMAVMETQEDGWYNAELKIGTQTRRGLIPSNYVERI